MTTFVEAIRRKYEKLTEYTIFETFTQKSNNRIGANILFPAKSLTMDCQQISRIGCEAELIRAAGHVVDLDLSGNKFKSWNEVSFPCLLLYYLHKLSSERNYSDNRISEIFYNSFNSLAFSSHNLQLPRSTSSP